MGINATRALTCKYNAQLSCGRVQTPTLAMIARREQEIKEFVPKEYFGMTLKPQVSAGAGRIRRAEATAPLIRNRRKKLKKELEGKSIDGDLCGEGFQNQNAPGLCDLTELHGMPAAASVIRQKKP